MSELYLNKDVKKKWKKENRVTETETLKKLVTDTYPEN